MVTPRASILTGDADRGVRVELVGGPRDGQTPVVPELRSRWYLPRYRAWEAGHFFASAADVGPLPPVVYERRGTSITYDFVEDE